LGNLRFTLSITQNGQLTLTNNHDRKTTSFSSTFFTAIRSQRHQMGECTSLHRQSLLPIFDSPPTLDNLRSTLPITQNGQLTFTNNHGRKKTTSFSTTFFTARRSHRRQMGECTSLHPRGLLPIVVFRFTHFRQPYVHTPYNSKKLAITQKWATDPGQDERSVRAQCTHFGPGGLAP
jgi:hypothetical protein